MIKNLCKILLLVLCVGMNWIAFSQEQEAENQDAENQSNLKDKQSSACQEDGFIFREGALVLNNDGQGKSRIFQIQNNASGQIKLDHFAETDPGMSAGWASSLDAGMYSLLAMNQSNFSIKCMINNPPVEWGLIDCSRVLKVCAITPKQALGSFWMLENKPLAETLKMLKERRITN